MEWENWVVFFLATTLFSFSPGPGAINIMSVTLGYGYRFSLFTIAGQELGILVHFTLAITGIGFLITASEELMGIMRWSGSLYLVYLGINKFRESPPDQSIKLMASDGLSIFLKAFVVNLLNPKVIVFIMAFVPQFIALNQPQSIQYCSLGATLLCVDAFAMLCYAGFSFRILSLFTNNFHMQRILFGL